MHQAGAPQLSFTRPHTDEWQEIENAAHGVCMGQFELRFMSESATRRIFCHSPKLTSNLNFLERLGQGFFLVEGEGSGIWKLPLLPLKKTY